MDAPDPARDAHLAARFATRLGCIAASALALPVATVLALLDVTRKCAPGRSCTPDFWLHVALPTSAFVLFAWGFARRRVLGRFAVTPREQEQPGTTEDAEAIVIAAEPPHGAPQ